MRHGQQCGIGRPETQLAYASDMTALEQLDAEEREVRESLWREVLGLLQRAAEHE